VVRIKSPSLGSPFDGGLKVQPNDGWFYPGDRGVIRDDGLLAIVGRTDTVINAGGLKLSPEFIEDVLVRNPRIRDVAVLGVRSEARTQVRAVVVVSEPATADEIMAWLHRAAPGALLDEVCFADAIPRTASGKIAREALARAWGDAAAAG
jgi:acyl-coenzyme A synthetase/AMP-(fatty) acid ligase